MVKAGKAPRKKFKIKLAPYLLLIPWFIGMGLFRIYPIIASFINSLYHYQPIRGTREFVGLDNYRRLLFDFPHFWDSVTATMRYVLWGTPLVLIMAFFIAFILNFNLKGVNLFRTAYYIPSILGGNVAVAIVWSQVFGGAGPVNQVLGIFNIDPIVWTRDVTFAPFTLIFLSAWQFGSVMLIFLAALQNVSPSLYEAASIDGAKKWRQLFSITLPLITPVLLFNTVNVLLRHFQEFNSAYLITLRGPARATDFLVILIYEYAFRRMQFGFALAMTMMLLVIIGILTLIVFLTSKYWVHYND